MHTNIIGHLLKPDGGKMAINLALFGITASKHCAARLGVGKTLIVNHLLLSPGLW